MRIYPPPSTGPAILTFDVETAPLLGHVWSLWEQNVGINQIAVDWHLLSWAAKWLNDPPEKIMYMDQRRAENLEDDSQLLRPLHGLIDKADFVLTHYGKQFDNKKINARFIINGFKPPSPVRHLDTKAIAKKHFGFTSNKLEYLSEKLNKRYRKMKHEQYPGFELWKACLNRDRNAWKIMEAYNKHDVLALEELYAQLAPWDNTSFAAFDTDDKMKCKCGSTSYKRNGYHYTGQNRYQRYKCRRCGWEWRTTKAEGKATRVTGCARS